jgi:DNA repair photolyase
LERRDLAAFETEIYAKEWNGAAFAEELHSVKPGHILGIGTATDPYQPAERKFRLTRQVLEALVHLRDVSIFITTKSNLVSRDADVLKRLAERNEVMVTLTVTTMDRNLARLTEPYAPRPDLRVRAVQQLVSAGIPAGIIANPVLPLITDSKENLESVARAAKAAGAVEFGANVVFLMPSAQRVFFPFLAEHFPQHLKRYEVSFRAGAYLRGAYPDRIRRTVAAIRERVGIPRRDMMRAVTPPASKSQMLLF